jgi:hypothetical protein
LSADFVPDRRTHFFTTIFYLVTEYEARLLALRATEGDESSPRPIINQPQDSIPPHEIFLDFGVEQY